MTYYFNLYDSRHYGILLNQIDEETYQSFLTGEDEDTSDLNIVILQLDTRHQYWVDIPEDYDYWAKTPVTIFSPQPRSSSGRLFSLKYNSSSRQWETSLI